MERRGRGGGGRGFGGGGHQKAAGFTIEGNLIKMVNSLRVE